MGAGPAGLAAGAALRAAGLRALILERATLVGATWRARYDRLHLNTSRRLSRLPGLPFSRHDDRWPSRDQVVAYLERYARHHHLDLLLDVSVERIDRDGEGWQLRTSRGPMSAPHVVVATGQDGTPVIPNWPGRETFTGELIHSVQYQNAGPYGGRDVLVVGPGDSGADIAVDLAEGGAARVRLSVRSVPHIVRRAVAGVPADVQATLIRRLPPRAVDPVIRVLRRFLIGDLSPFGLPMPRDGLYEHFLRYRRAPIIDPGAFVRAVKGRRIEIVPAVERFEDGTVVLADGSLLRPDAVVAATGYRPALEDLVGHLGVLAPDGYPAVHAPHAHPAAPGLYLLGLRFPFSGNFRQIRIDARKLARSLRGAAPPRTGRGARGQDHPGILGATTE